MVVSKSLITAFFKAHVNTKGIPCLIKGKHQHSYGRCLLQFRPFSTNKDSRTRTQNFEVSSFGTLRLKSTRFETVSISPIDPVECPDQNVLSVAISGGKDCDYLTGQVLQNIEGICIDDSSLPPEEDSLYKLNILLPIKFDINIDSSQLKTVSVKNLENSAITIQGVTERCFLQNIKSGHVDVRTSGGDIESVSAFQADGVLHTTGQGKVTLDKPVCQNLEVETQFGDIILHNSYSRSLHVTTETGDVTMGNAHRHVNVDIKQKGKLKIDTLDGTLDAKVKSGFVDVYVSQHDSVDVQMESGDIVLKLDNAKRTDLSLTGSEIITDEQFDIIDTIITGDRDIKTLTGHLIGDKGDTSRKGRKVLRVPTQDVTPKINARTGEGSIVLKCRDWLSALKLGQELSNKE